MRTRRFLARSVGVALAAGWLTTAADAHGPTRQKASEAVDIAAPPAKVWAAIGRFHDLAWFPLVDHVAGGGGDTVGATRQVFLKAGGELDEELTKFDAAAMQYTTFLPHNDPKVLPVTNFSTDIRVEPVDGGTSHVVWRAAFYRGYPNADPPPELNDAAAVTAVKAFLRSGLDALKQKVEAGS